jgi:hypothetical protein
VIKKVAYLEIIYDKHCIKRCHQGIIKTYDQIGLRYLGIRRLVEIMFRKYCFVCDLKVKQQSHPRLTPIISNSLFERVLLDLVDMRSCPDGVFKWIAHFVEHNAQYDVLSPQ